MYKFTTCDRIALIANAKHTDEYFAGRKTHSNGIECLKARLEEIKRQIKTAKPDTERAKKLLEIRANLEQTLSKCR